MDQPLEAVVEKLSPNTDYYFRVCAMNGSHDKRGEYQVVSAKTIAIPGPPQKVHIIEKRLTCFKIGWAAPAINPKNVKYVVHIRKDCDSKWLHLDQLLPSKCLSVVITGLDTNTYYQVCVRALNQS